MAQSHHHHHHHHHHHLDRVLEACEEAVQDFVTQVSIAHAHRCDHCVEPSRHYNACGISRTPLPHAQCRSKEEGPLFHVPLCDKDCRGAPVDTTTSVVQIPSHYKEYPWTPSVLESICMGKDLDQDFFQARYAKLRQDLYDITGLYESPTFTWGSSTNGVARTFPGRRSLSSCPDNSDNDNNNNNNNNGVVTTDARWSPWYAAGLSAAAAAPKTVVIVWDVCLDKAHDSSHLDYARQVVQTFLQSTLTDQDSIAILLTSPNTTMPQMVLPPDCHQHNEDRLDNNDNINNENVNIVDADPSTWSTDCPLAKATLKNRRRLRAALHARHWEPPKGPGNLPQTVDTAFDILRQASLPVGDVAVVLFTHEFRLRQLNVPQMRQRGAEIQHDMERNFGIVPNGADFRRLVQFFAYLSGQNPRQLTPLAEKTECALEGIWHVLHPLQGEKGIANAIHLFQSAYTVQNRPLAVPPATSLARWALWTEPFMGGRDKTSVLQTSVSQPVYDTASVSPPFFVGVASIGLSMEFLWQVAAGKTNGFNDRSNNSSSSSSSSSNMMRDRVNKDLQIRRKHGVLYNQFSRLRDCELKALRLDSRQMMMAVEMEDNGLVGSWNETPESLDAVGSSLVPDGSCPNITCNLLRLPKLQLPLQTCHNRTLLLHHVVLVDDDDDDNDNIGVDDDNNNDETAFANLTCCRVPETTGLVHSKPQCPATASSNKESDDDHHKKDPVEHGRGGLVHLLSVVALLLLLAVLGVVAYRIYCRKGRRRGGGGRGGARREGSSRFLCR